MTWPSVEHRNDLPQMERMAMMRVRYRSTFDDPDAQVHRRCLASEIVVRALLTR